MRTGTETRKLSEVARHLVLPRGITSSGWPAVRGTLGELGVVFDGWQQGAAKAILAKRADGLYAADTAAMSIPRQVGKTFLIGWIIFALCIIFPNRTAIWSAHRYPTAAETFKSMYAMASLPIMAPHIDIDRCMTAAGAQCIVFRNGSRILFGARERGFGRGFAKVDIVVFDEAQILGANAIDDMVPATNQSDNPLVLAIGTPPKPSDPGEFFTQVRVEALAGESDDALYVEFSADEDADPNDREQWGKANPSYPTRTSARAILRMRKMLSSESFMREALGIWDAADIRSVIPALDWASTKDQGSLIVTRPTFALDVSPDQSWAAIAVAGLRDDGLTHVEVTSSGGVLDYRPGVSWVEPRLVAMTRSRPELVVHILAGSSAVALVPSLRTAGVTVEVVEAASVAPACVMFGNLGRARELRHFGQPELTAAVEGAAKLDVGDGLWKLGRRKSSVDITPAYAVVAALWVCHLYVPEPNVW